MVEMRRTKLWWGALSCALLISACAGGGKSVEVSRDQYGSQWPWPQYASGTIRCSQDAVSIELGGTLYGLNGRAQSRDNLPDARQKMARTPGTESISADGLGLYEVGATDDIIQVGLRLCS